MMSAAVPWMGGVEGGAFGVFAGGAVGGGEFGEVAAAVEEGGGVAVFAGLGDYGVEVVFDAAEFGGSSFP